MDNVSDPAPIGIFDSGFGGLTVARDIARYFPHESLIYLGDTERCPYGTRDQREVRLFVEQIGMWLEQYGAKLLVIACNTATAAALYTLQHLLSVPVIGVIEPGARAAVEVTRMRRVGVLATRATVNSGSYVRAIRTFDVGVFVAQCAAQPLVEIVERRIMSHVSPGLRRRQERRLFDTPEIRDEIQKSVEVFISAGVDTVILGCTHFSFLAAHIQEGLGKGIRVVNSAAKACQQIADILKHRGGLAPPDHRPTYQFVTTSHNCVDFAAGVRFVFDDLPSLVSRIDLVTLEALVQ